jgi:hypothetical protein
MKIIQGVQCTRGAVILFADADGATKFEDLNKLEASLLKEVRGIVKNVILQNT